MKRFVIIALTAGGAKTARQLQEHLQEQSYHTEVVFCLLYTSDAADE